MRVAPTTTARLMASMILHHIEDNDISQAELARLIGRTPKHVNQVLHGKSGTGELDYWAWVLGMKFDVSLSQRSDGLCP
jgi:plasmid maintenance system antidote protein VapI